MFFFDQSPAVMTTITGGMSADTFQVVSTVALDRTAFDAADGLVTVSASSTGLSQHIDVRDGKTDTENHFSLTFTPTTGSPEQTGYLAFTSTAAQVQAALRLLAGLSGVTVTGGSGVFNVTFPSSFASVQTLLATHEEKLVNIPTPSGAGLQQHLDISPATGGNGYFTIKLDYQETKPLPLSATASDVLAAMQAAFTELGDPVDDISCATAGCPTFDFKFASGLGSVDPMQAQLVPLYVDGGAGDDQLNVQSIYEDMFFNGGAGNDTSNVNVNAITLAQFHPSDVVGHIDVNEKT